MSHSLSPSIDSLYNTQTFNNFSYPIPNRLLIFSIRKTKTQKKWTKEEDELLLQLAKKNSEKNWKEISKQFSKKNYLQCFSRYKRIRPGLIKGNWKREEDLKIIDLVAKYGKSWSKISKILGNRNGKQIRDRYMNVLDPAIKKGKFSIEEDNMLIKLYFQYGPKWATIAKYYTNRTADMVKNRFYSSIKKRLEKGTSNSIRKTFEKNNLYKKNSFQLYSSSIALSESEVLNIKIKGEGEEIEKGEFFFTQKKKENESKLFFFSNNINIDNNYKQNFNIFSLEQSELDFSSNNREFNQLSQEEFNFCFEDWFKMNMSN